MDVAGARQSVLLSAKVKFCQRSFSDYGLGLMTTQSMYSKNPSEMGLDDRSKVRVPIVCFTMLNVSAIAKSVIRVNKISAQRDLQ